MFVISRRLPLPLPLPFGVHHYLRAAACYCFPCLYLDRSALNDKDREGGAGKVDHPIPRLDDVWRPTDADQVAHGGGA